MGFPSIPGVTYNGLMTTGDVFDFGPLFNDGILTILPPLFVASPYPAFVPRTDSDGNDVAGVRLPRSPSHWQHTPAGAYAAPRLLETICVMRSARSWTSIRHRLNG